MKALLEASHIINTNTNKNIMKFISMYTNLTRINNMSSYPTQSNFKSGGLSSLTSHTLSLPHHLP
ncbi:hypothetical protein Hanom_Chr04g00344911 [Helianthus anomalus]